MNLAAMDSTELIIFFIMFLIVSPLGFNLYNIILILNINFNYQYLFIMDVVNTAFLLGYPCSHG